MGVRQEATTSVPRGAHHHRRLRRQALWKAQPQLTVQQLANKLSGSSTRNIITVHIKTVNQRLFTYIITRSYRLYNISLELVLI